MLHNTKRIAFVSLTVKRRAQRYEIVYVYLCKCSIKSLLHLRNWNNIKISSRWFVPVETGRAPS